MGKSLFIAEKPSVAKEFAKVLQLNTSGKDGYLESDTCIVTWCVGHLVSMSYPEVYDPALKKWSMDTLPFIPTEYKYEVIDSVKKQFHIVSGLLNREDVTTIYVCTDSGREGEYIYRLVEQQAHVTGKIRKRVWIDSQTEEEIKRGIREARDLSEYDHLSDAAYLRAKEDYLMGINFSRVLTLKFGYPMKNFLHTDRAVIAVGRVMTCVLGIIVNREREIRNFVKTPFYRVVGDFVLGENSFAGEWKVQDASCYMNSPKLYKENGFKEQTDAEELVHRLQGLEPTLGTITRKKETKAAPLLYNLAELQNDCSKYFKISPDETLRLIQEMYEKKMLTYPRTDARVLSTAVSREIGKNIAGLKGFPLVSQIAEQILQSGSYQKIASTKYVNDKQITDHYAIIPTGQGLNNYASLNDVSRKIYEIVCRRFLSIFLPPAVYQKIALELDFACPDGKHERFYANFKVLAEEGYLSVAKFSFARKKEERKEETDTSGQKPNRSPEDSGKSDRENEEQEIDCDNGFFEALNALKKGQTIPLGDLVIKEGETSPPKRYNSGSIILTMENAGQFIEDEDLRAQIKGSGIGTSATRAEILKKLFGNKYLHLNPKTQIITPTLQGEMIYDIVNAAIRPLLDPALTASWERGLTMVADGSITGEEYMEKLDGFVRRRTEAVKKIGNAGGIMPLFREAARYYQKENGNQKGKQKGETS